MISLPAHAGGQHNTRVRLALDSRVVVVAQLLCPAFLYVPFLGEVFQQTGAFRRLLGE